jgi:hypothetical protein
MPLLRRDTSQQSDANLSGVECLLSAPTIGNTVINDSWLNSQAINKRLRRIARRCNHGRIRAAHGPQPQTFGPSAGHITVGMENDRTREPGDGGQHSRSIHVHQIDPILRHNPMDYGAHSQRVESESG